MREWRRGDPEASAKAPAPLRLPQLEKAIVRVAAEYGVTPYAISSGSRRSEVSRARAAVAHIAIAVHRLPAREVALRLGVTHAAVLRGSRRAGRKTGA
jgi:chromosomal replication initiation ATPase DnaA